MRINKIIAGTSIIALSLSMTSVAFAATTAVSQDTGATIAENLTLACDATIDIDGGTAIVADGGTTVEENTTTCVVTTNDADGYHLQIREVTQLAHDIDGDLIANKAAWTPGSPNAAAYSGTGLGFRVSNNDTGAMNTTWWGNATTCTGNDAAVELYAGLPTALADILEENDYNSGSSTTTICYALGVPSTQKTGEYSGTVEYSVTTGV